MLGKNHKYSYRIEGDLKLNLAGHRREECFSDY